MLQPVSYSLQLQVFNWRSQPLPATVYIKGKGKDHPRTDHEGPEVEYRHSSTLYLTSALDGVGGQHHAPAVLPPVKDPVPIVWEAGWAPGEAGWAPGTV
jgi:hypothetical protein